MDTIKIKGIVTHSRKMTVELPPSFPTGEVEITVQAPLELYISYAAHSWSDDALDSLFEFTPTKARNLVVGGWNTHSQDTRTTPLIQAKH